MQLQRLETKLDVDLRQKLETLNSLRIRRVVGNENDNISKVIQEILK